MNGTPCPGCGAPPAITVGTPYVGAVGFLWWKRPFEEQLYAVDRAVESAGLVFASVRGHALDNNDPVARFWRDVRVGGHHARALIGRLRLLGA